MVRAEDLSGTRKLILDLATWLQRFCIYMAIVTEHEPERLKPLLAYLSTIAKASAKFSWPSWVVYNQNFRQEAADSGCKDWSKVDPSIYTQCFMNTSLSGESWCRICQSIDHWSSTCPLRGKSSSSHNTANPQKRLLDLALLAPKKPQPVPHSVPQPCRCYNQYNGDCRFGEQCIYMYHCESCGKPGHTISPKIDTPVKLSWWKSALANHPDQAFAKHILDGLEQGFRIGFNHDKSVVRQSGCNIPCPNPEAVDKYLARIMWLSKEKAASARVHCSPIEIIPKRNKPGKWWLIVDLSVPDGASTNDGVDKEICNLSYTSVNYTAVRVASMGQDTQLAKMHIKQAYRMIPVHRCNRRLLEMQWRDGVFMDKTIPFGIRSTLLIFTAVADALQ